MVTGGTYAYLEMKKNASVAGSAKCNGINYQGQEINASNLSSTTNYLEGTKSTITLSQSDDCKIYSYVNIYLHVNDNITAPLESVKALKYKLITEDKIEYNGTITTKGDSLLAVVPLTSDPKSYQVYLWIDSGISNGQYDNKSFSGYIYATSEQSSTIGSEEVSNNENVSIETIDFDYVGREQEFIVPVSGDYKLETWGAQGGSIGHSGGAGGYARGIIKLNNNFEIYIVVGGVGQNGTGDFSNSGELLPGVLGGYNGGGRGGAGWHSSGAGGGGATHIASSKGVLQTFLKNIDDVYIVSGGGGGACTWGDSAAGGGYVGADVADHFDQNGTLFSFKSYGGKQTGEDSLFGKGQDATDRAEGHGWGAEGKGGGGAGFYGGTAVQIDGEHTNSPGGGGSGYIGNSLLTNKAMYCYNCEESDGAETKTISTTNVSGDVVSEYAKYGNGYARITLIK